MKVSGMGRSMNMDVVFCKPRLLRALTSLDWGEFVRLEAGLEALLEAGRSEHTYDGQVRQRAYGAGVDKSKLPTARHKLLLILFYFKSYPTQEVMGVFFGISQPQVCEWVKRLTPLLAAVLGRELLLPARRPADLQMLLADTPELLLLLDGTERPIRRPKDKDDQKTNYSGKKKGHRKKNLLVATGDKRVVYVGATRPGSVHDKKLADESALVFPPGAVVLQDLGLQGYQAAGAKETLLPKKKPRRRELLASEKARNKLLAHYRVGVEHAIAGLKRCRIVFDTFRNLRTGLVDAVMEVAAGLHNLRVTTRGGTLA